MNLICPSSDLLSFDSKDSEADNDYNNPREHEVFMHVVWNRCCWGCCQHTTYQNEHDAKYVRPVIGFINSSGKNLSKTSYMHHNIAALPSEFLVTSQANSRAIGSIGTDTIPRSAMIAKHAPVLSGFTTQIRLSHKIPAIGVHILFTRANW